MSEAVVLDEGHCLWPSCCHSCCWQSEQRIREGHPRIRRTDPNNKPFTRPCAECRVPIFTLVDATNWTEEAFISWRALPRETLPQKPHHSTALVSAQMDLNQAKKTKKTAVVDVAPESLSIQVFPPEDWMSPRSQVETERHSPSPSTTPVSTKDPKDPRFKDRAFKTDVRLSKRMELNDTELFIRGITAPRNSKQSSLASSTVELNQLHLEL